MNTNNYTIKSQEALQNAVQLAQSKGQQAIETGHLLKAVINVGENVTHFIFNKLGVNSHNLLSALDRTWRICTQGRTAQESEASLP